MLIYLQSLLLLCRVAVLLTLILTLCRRSSPLLQSQTANLVTLPSLIARPVPILRQNVMPILLTSVITSTSQKTNNTSIIKREPPSSNPGYDYGTYPCKLFLLYRENWNIPYSDYDHNLVKYLPSSIKICHTPSTMQTWTHPCDTDFSTPQLSETGHIKNFYLYHRDTYVAGKTGLSTFQNMD